MIGSRFHTLEGQVEIADDGMVDVLRVGSVFPDPVSYLQNK